MQPYQLHFIAFNHKDIDIKVIKISFWIHIIRMSDLALNNMLHCFNLHMLFVIDALNYKYMNQSQTSKTIPQG